MSAEAVASMLSLDAPLLALFWLRTRRFTERAFVRSVIAVLVLVAHLRVVEADVTALELSLGDRAVVA